MEELDYIEKPKRGHRRNAMWIWCCAGCTAGWIFICCSIPLVGMIAGAMFFSNEVSDTETQTLAVDNVEVINLEVRNPMGGTSIVSDRSVDEIVVEIVRRANGISDSHAQSALDSINVDVRRDGDTFIVDVEHGDEGSFSDVSWRQVDLRITVPQEQLNLIAENNVGGLTVRNVNIAERMELISSFGGIEFVGVIGPTGEYIITNDTGGISVEVSRDSSFALDATAEKGGVDVSLTRSWQQTDHDQLSDGDGERYAGTYGTVDENEPAATLTITTDVGGIEIHD